MTAFLVQRYLKAFLYIENMLSKVVRVYKLYADVDEVCFNFLNFNSMIHH